MKTCKIYIIAVTILSTLVLFSMELNATTSGVAAPKLARIIITTDANATSPESCIQILMDETITVYAIGLDEAGKPFAISKDSIVHWSGADGIEVKSVGSHSATVKLTKPLMAAEVKLSNHLKYDGKSFGSSAQIAQQRNEIPKNYRLATLGDPTRDREMDVQNVKVGESITFFVRGLSNDMATMGELFTLPQGASISWRTAPTPPTGPEVRITPFGCHSARVDIIKTGQFMPSGSILIEATFKDGTKKNAAISYQITP